MMDIFFANFSIRAISISTFQNTISDIIQLAAYKKMIRSDTRRIVTLM